MLRGPEKTRTLLDAALKRVTCGDAEGVLEIQRTVVTRFAANRIHQNVAEEDAAASFRVAVGARVGGARTNGRDRSRLGACVRRAADIAQAQAEDPSFPGFARSKRARNIQAYDITAAALSPRDRARAVSQAITHANRAGVEVSGALTVTSSELAIANSRGTYQYHPSTLVQFHVVARKGGAEGAWTDTSERWADVDVGRAAQRAIDTCTASREPAAIDPGEWPVVLQADAVADVIELLAYMGLGGQSFVEERSFLSGTIGMKVVSETVTLVDDPLRQGGRPRPFDYEGVPARKVAIIERGVARGPVHDRTTAAKAGTESTGHALPQPNTIGPYPLNLVLEPGEATLEQMIASTARGILVSRFHCTNPVDPRRTVITGMTRFGTFLIEDGKVTKPVRSMRFTDSVLEALGRVQAVGKELRRVGTTLAPALKLSSWRFTGVTGE